MPEGGNVHHAANGVHRQTSPTAPSEAVTTTARGSTRRPPMNGTHCGATVPQGRTSPTVSSVRASVSTLRVTGHTAPGPSKPIAR
ncbi:hypothetical protein ACFYUY_17660 [Kitasatospora sp. NPDC004745]|uniref:hypothetical protein n=1 Tax=Kitasatospora sp. NPDC004745 TaxID=3364019 RepID=UPI0036BD2449